MIFLAAMESPEANPGPESFEARLFSEDEIPWDKIAFNSVDKILSFILKMPKQEIFLSTTSSGTNKGKSHNHH